MEKPILTNKHNFNYSKSGESKATKQHSPIYSNAKAVNECETLYNGAAKAATKSEIKTRLRWAKYTGRDDLNGRYRFNFELVV